jgi:hypothetical protein
MEQNMRALKASLEYKSEEQKYPGSTFTFAKITGASRAAVDAGVRHYMREYPPEGYATKIEIGPASMGRGKFIARLRRYSSCD